MKSWCVYSGVYDRESHYENDFGWPLLFSCESEGAVVLRLFDKWPELRIQAMRQARQTYHRTVIWIFEDGSKTEPCGVLVNVEHPEFKPDWEVWRPYLEVEC